MYVHIVLCLSLTPEVVSRSSAESGGGGGGGGGGAELQAPSVPINPEEPTTTLQIRLADGKRLVSKFNHSHTVNDVRNFINLYPQVCSPPASVARVVCVNMFNP